MALPRYLEVVRYIIQVQLWVLAGVVRSNNSIASVVEQNKGVDSLLARASRNLATNHRVPIIKALEGAGGVMGGVGSNGGVGCDRWLIVVTAVALIP